MSELEKLNLPGSGYEVISKILHAYALCGDKPASLDDVSSKAAMDKTLVSRNNGFLVSLGLLTGGKSKLLSPEGRTLAVAIGHDLEEDVSQAWKKAILASVTAKPVLDMIKVQKAVQADALPARIAATLGLPDSPSTKTGTKTLIDILRKSGLIKEADGKISLTANPSPDGPYASTAASNFENSDTSPPTKTPTQQPISLPINQPTTTSGNPYNPTIPIHVNIELHLPASAEQAVYDALFKSIREHLLIR